MTHPTCPPLVLRCLVHGGQSNSHRHAGTSVAARAYGHFRERAHPFPTEAARLTFAFGGALDSAGFLPSNQTESSEGKGKGGERGNRAVGLNGGEFRLMGVVADVLNEEKPMRTRRGRFSFHLGLLNENCPCIGMVSGELSLSFPEFGMRSKRWFTGHGGKTRASLRKVMKCLCSAEQLGADEMIQSSESLATRDYAASACSSRTVEGERKRDTGNIEEAESSLRESGCLNYEEARALLGRLEYQRGNVEAALHVFDGIDIGAITPKMKHAMTRKVERRKRRMSDATSASMSMHAVSLLFEAIFLKAKSLQDLGRFKEAAQSCKVILDTVESALPEGLPENFGTDCKLQETLNMAVELLPELWKLAGFFHEAILSYRRALLYCWNLDNETTAKIQKEFAIFLLYGGCDATPPNLRSQMEGSFIPKSNIEEAVLLLLILLRNCAQKRIQWDPSLVDHLTFALSVSGELTVLANQIEGLLPGVLSRKEKYYTLALCYFGEGEDLTSLNLLKKLLSTKEDPNCVEALLLASKICGDKKGYAEEGISFAQRALDLLSDGCDQRKSVAYCLLGISYSTRARFSLSEAERITRQSEALGALETAEKVMLERYPKIIFQLSLENAEQRKLDVALDYAKELLRVEGGSNIKGWILLARILTAQKRFPNAEMAINAALEQTGKWDQGELLRTKAKIQIARAQLKDAIETYTHLLAVLQVRSKSFGTGKRLLKRGGYDRSLEVEIWHDLAQVYTSMSQWRDAEICLNKSKALMPHSASRWHATGLLYEMKDLHNEALRAFKNALEIDPIHVPSLVSLAMVLRHFGDRTLPVVRSYLTEALKLDRTNHAAWFNLGLVHKAEGGLRSAFEAADCFQAAALLEESAPVEPFRCIGEMVFSVYGCALGEKQFRFMIWLQIMYLYPVKQKWNFPSTLILAIIRVVSLDILDPHITDILWPGEIRFSRRRSWWR
ncbi:hypothetical protein H6P81_013018 [Aristolochia fimbriata]|uniref:Uncharacterized protein n=1 Tax=Aristolochia fimbriata TaxID=158543 RepID=A0AAV7EFN4_ARIFI|nr:hypothetical protein H6P81_013018 [Aristolochia fimbriata]